jgi:hypothetical protein
VEVVSVPLLMSLGWSKYSLSHSREAAEYACKEKDNSNIQALKLAAVKSRKILQKNKVWSKRTR